MHSALPEGLEPRAKGPFGVALALEAARSERGPRLSPEPEPEAEAAPEAEPAVEAADPEGRGAPLGSSCSF